MDYSTVIAEIIPQIKAIKDKGKIATYIPELSKIPPEKFGLNLHTITGEDYNYGDFDEKFSLQSIAKVFSLALAYKILGADIWERVGVEPSGNAFNSLVQLEYENGIPRNPFINAGALVICDILWSELENPKVQMLNFIRETAGTQNIYYNAKVARSEKNTGFRNIALINFMKSYGNIKNNTEDVLDFYYNLCSVEMTCRELSKSFLPFANNGILPDKSRLMQVSRIKRLNALMLTCGFYDESGEFAFKVGLPGKSGVGGGIVAVHPGRYSIAVWSPGLNEKGNSKAGMKALELLTTAAELSIF